MSTKNARKIGLMASISVLVSSVIGIGIFFKNGTVFANNNNNAIGVLISWILASIIALTTAFSFCEIGFGKKKGAGLSGAVESMYGKKFGRFIAFNQTFFYGGILYVCIAIFSAEAILNVALTSKQAENFHLSYIMVIALGLIFIFLLFNYFASKLSEKTIIVSTIIKFFPLIAVGLVGIIFGAMHPENSLFGNKPTNANGVEMIVGNISISGILSSLPSILFAYDSFLSIGNIKHEMKNSKKQVPLAMTIGMIFCIFAYLFITIGQILTSSGIAEQVFEWVHFQNPKFSAYALSIVKIVLNVFIMISILGVLNALTLSYLRVLQHSMKERVIIGWWLFKKTRNSSKLTMGLISGFIIYGFWWLVLFIPSMILNTDAFVDGLSNFPTLFMFLIYGLVVLKGFINRVRKKPNEEKVKGFLIIAPIAVIGCFLAFGYQFFYKFSIETIMNPNDVVNWGLFFTQGYKVKNWQGMIWFIVALLTFIVLPFVNDLINKTKYNKMKFDEIIKIEKSSNKDYSKIVNQLYFEYQKTNDWRLINKIEKIQNEWSIYLDELSENHDSSLDPSLIYDKNYLKKELIV